MSDPNILSIRDLQVAAPDGTVLLFGSVGPLTIAPHRAFAQANTCRWANDNECDESRYNGTGACENGTDANDCRTEAAAWQRSGPLQLELPRSSGY